MSNGFKNAMAIQAINAFIIGTISIAIPLLMVEREIPVESMGLIFAALPVISQTVRIFFGSISDYVGRKKFFFLSGMMNVAFLATYYFAYTPLMFLFGKVNEALRDASLWAVNRAYFLDHTDHHKEKEKILIKLRGLGSMFEAAGTMLAGFLIVTLFYDRTLLLLIGLSMLVLPNVALLRDKVRKKVDVKAVVRCLDFRHKSRRFKNFVAIQFFFGFSWGLVSGYIMPLFLKSIGISVDMIGLLLGARILFTGLVMYVFTSVWSCKRKMLIGGTLFSIIVALFGFSTPASLPFLIVFFGIAVGLVDAGYEGIFVMVSDHNTLGRDIGILLIGVHAGMAVTQAVSGFVIASFGFTILFFLSSAFFLAYTIATYMNMKEETAAKV